MPLPPHTHFSSQDHAEYGELGSWELLSIVYIRDISPETSPLYAECKAKVGRVGYLEEVAFLCPHIVSASGKSLVSLETLGLTWKWSNSGCETWK